MKNFRILLSLLLLIVLSLYSFYGLMPRYNEEDLKAADEFSVDRAIEPLAEISKKPHYVGSPGHTEVRMFLLNELRKLGLEPHIQEGFSLNPDSRTLVRPVNIAARIPGSKEGGKALLLLSHYDSAAVPSFGAADAGSGVVTILESVRAYLASGARPENDIIILFTDAEEIGLDGARLFVEEHPWVEDVGLVLNFEARGTGGPSNMIIETNTGNGKLIKEFIKANPDFPVTSSLMYSVYKILPNDTDSTVFRTEADIDSFFFAFIDGHQNYHTANDTLYYMDWSSLAHQGSYLLPLLHYFGGANLSDLKSENDHVYFSLPLPFLKIIQFPFSWILPLLILAAGLFVFLIFYGIYNRRLRGIPTLKGFLPLITALAVNFLIAYFGWKILLKIYPGYSEIQQGFTYNGHWYILFFVFIAVGSSLLIYRRFNLRENTASYFVAPLFIWIVINAILYFKLKGAAFFIVPVFFGLLSFYLILRHRQVNELLMVFLAAPAIFILAPLIQFFPVGLGLKMLFGSSVLTVLLLSLLLPVFSSYKRQKLLGITCLVLAVSFFTAAHFKSRFAEDRRKPNSLIYYHNAGTGENFWLTYDGILDEWTRKYLGEQPRPASEFLENKSYSKYGRNYSFAAPAPSVEIPPFEVEVLSDEVVSGLREVSFRIMPNRLIHRLELYSENDTGFEELIFNGKPVSDSGSGSFRGVSNPALINYYVSGNHPLEVSLKAESEKPLEFKVLEYSFDLMTHPQFEIEERPAGTMPKPFVVTDAIAVERSFSIPLNQEDEKTD